ncbi:MAG TPA: selenide, water dikinase SelD [Thermoanaerobaculia bacterium]|nr:selenide, water dikinase SelD [Thermoanaerobaculia bacterium]
MGQDDLVRVLAQLPPHLGGDLLVDESTGDDAAVLRIDGDRVLVQTVDFFTPIVDDPYLFGSIAAANAVSDVYAMGAEPILGLAVVGFPSDELPLELLAEILRGGADKAKEAGFPIAGGHTIIDAVPKYGLAVTGIAPAGRIVRNSTGRPGDRLYLTKPIGNGVLIAAWRGTAASGVRKLIRRRRPSVDEAIRWMGVLNRDASRAMLEAGASAATDVTGYGLLGHLTTLCRASGTGARVSAASVPLLEGAREWLARGFVPEGSKRNLEAYGSALRSAVPDDDLILLCDAQTSGGLLIAIPPEREPALLEASRARELAIWRIGELTANAGIVEISE